MMRRVTWASLTLLLGVAGCSVWGPTGLDDDPDLERELDRFHRDTGVDPYDPTTRTPGDR